MADFSALPPDLVDVPFQALVEQSVAGVYIIQDETFQYTNATFSEMVGYSPEEMRGRPLAQCVPQGFAPEVMERYRKRISGEVPSMRFITQGLHRDSSTVYIEVHGRAMEFRGRPAVVGVGVNVTEQVLSARRLGESEARYRQLAAYMNTRLEHQRAHDARELHDVLGGLLTAMKLDVSRLNRRAATRELRDIATDLHLLLQEAIDNVREMSESMRPQTLDHLGLGPAIEAYIGRFQERAGVRVRLSQTGVDLSLSAARATRVFRIVQEALTNVARHARASEAELVVAREGAEFFVHISDNGLGIAGTELAGNDRVWQGLGLLSMRERAHELGGTLGIGPRPGGGTVIQLRAPVLAEDPVA